MYLLNTPDMSLISNVRIYFNNSSHCCSLLSFGLYERQKEVTMMLKAPEIHPLRLSTSQIHVANTEDAGQASFFQGLLPVRR